MNCWDYLAYAVGHCPICRELWLDPHTHFVLMHPDNLAVELAPVERITCSGAAIREALLADTVTVEVCGQCGSILYDPPTEPCLNCGADGGA